MNSQFTYLAVTDAGARITGSVRSRDRREAMRKILEMGYHPVQVSDQPDSRSTSNLGKGPFRRIRITELAVFTRQLAALLKAGMRIVQALATLRGQCENPHLKQVVHELEEALGRDGGTLSDAMERYPHVFDPVYRGFVRAGEEGGTVVESLSALASYVARTARLRGQVVGAFIYAVFLVVVGTAAVCSLMIFVIPQFEALFSGFGTELPLPTKLLLACSRFLAQWWWLVLAGLVGAGAL